MDFARNPIERLSSDPEAQRLAEERKRSLLVQQHYITGPSENEVPDGLHASRAGLRFRSR